MMAEISPSELRRRQYEAALRDVEIAAKDIGLKIHGRKIRSLRAKLGLPLPKPKNKYQKYNPSDRAQSEGGPRTQLIVAALKKGLSYQDTASLIGCSYHLVKATARRHNLALARPGTPSGFERKNPRYIDALPHPEDP